MKLFLCASNVSALNPRRRARLVGAKREAAAHAIFNGLQSSLSLRALDVLKISTILQRDLGSYKLLFVV